MAVSQVKFCNRLFNYGRRLYPVIKINELPSSSTRRSKHSQSWYGEQTTEDETDSKKMRLSQALRVCEAAEESHYDWDYLTNPANREEIRQNVVNRKGVGNIDELVNVTFYIM